MTYHATLLHRDLGDGLRLRFATERDVDQIVEHNAAMMSDDPAQPDPHIAAWARDLLTRRHPGVGPEQFTVVEDVESGNLVSSLCVLPQRWAYAGVTFGVGAIDLVWTLPEYRQRGLVRQQFEVMHAWCARHELAVTAIDGIPNYYRQFGYEYALAQGAGSARTMLTVASSGAPSAAVRLRAATHADIPLLSELSVLAAQRSLVSVVRSDADWRYEIDGHNPDSTVHVETLVVERQDGEALGFVVRRPHPSNTVSTITACELRPEIAWLEVARPLLECLRALGAPDARQAVRLGFGHPLFALLPETFPNLAAPRAWYVRVAHLPEFLQLIRPVLETRLAASPLRGYSGDLRVSFFRGGFRMEFARGALVNVEPWQGDYLESSATFPGLTFLQLLFGHRSLAELRHAFPDCTVSEEHATALLETLLPRLPSAIRSVD